MILCPPRPMWNFFLVLLHHYHIRSPLSRTKMAGSLPLFSYKVFFKYCSSEKYSAKSKGRLLTFFIAFIYSHIVIWAPRATCSSEKKVILCLPFFACLYHSSANAGNAILWLEDRIWDHSNLVLNSFFCVCVLAV